LIISVAARHDGPPIWSGGLAAAKRQASRCRFPCAKTLKLRPSVIGLLHEATHARRDAWKQWTPGARRAHQLDSGSLLGTRARDPRSRRRGPGDDCVRGDRPVFHAAAAGPASRAGRCSPGSAPAAIWCRRRFRPVTADAAARDAMLGPGPAARRLSFEIESGFRHGGGHRAFEETAPHSLRHPYSQPSRAPNSKSPVAAFIRTSQPSRHKFGSGWEIPHERKAVIWATESMFVVSGGT